jgi:hypothetical protein
MNRESLIFCFVALLAALGLSTIGFRYAALPPEVLAQARTPVTPDKLPEFDLGGFGRVSGIDLVAYWVEHAPAPAQGGAAPPSVKRFGGC